MNQSHSDTAPSDEELFLRYRDALDREAFERLMRRCRGELQGYLRRQVGNATAAEDLLQATWLQVHVKRDQFDAARPLRPWLYSIAQHLAVDWLRRAGLRAAASLEAVPAISDDADDSRTLLDLLPGQTPGPLAEAEEHERAVWVHHALAELPDRLRDVVNLAYLQGFTLVDAAESLDIPEGTLKSRLHEALTRLHQLWDRDHQRPGGD